MDFNKYNKLREKINRKDFEGNYKALNSWLYAFSFIGNIGSIFFSYFLVFPNLYKAISINMVSGIWAMVLSFLFTNVFLIVFEIIKRYIVSSFSFNFISKNKKLMANNLSWLFISIIILCLSFYLSLIGSKNLATVSYHKNEIEIFENNKIIDSLTNIGNNEKLPYIQDNDKLREINNNLRKKLSDTPIGYVSVRNQYQLNIDKNNDIIQNNLSRMDNIDLDLKENINGLKLNLNEVKLINSDDDIKNIILFIIIAIFCEVIIFAGIYFREYFEFNSYLLNRDKFEKLYLRKDRYRSLIIFIFGEGKIDVGDKIISTQRLKELISTKTNIPNPNKFIDEFFHDMERMGILVINGKRRVIGVKYEDALNQIENYNDTIRYIENLK